MRFVFLFCIIKLGGCFTENSEQKKKIQVGTIINIKRGKTSASIEQVGESIPIYKDWTPELQAAQDKMFEDFAKAIYEEMQKYIANGGDLSKLDTPEGQEHYKEYRQKQIDEQKRKVELRKVKNKMTDEELEEFLKWKESKNKKLLSSIRFTFLRHRI